MENCELKINNSQTITGTYALYCLLNNHNLYNLMENVDYGNKYSPLFLH